MTCVQCGHSYTPGQMICANPHCGAALSRPAAPIFMAPTQVTLIFAGSLRLCADPSSQIQIGRSTADHVELRRLLATFGNVSRCHAVVRIDQQGMVGVSDLSSVNGTFINDRRLPVGVWHDVRQGDVVRFGADLIMQLG